MTRFRSPTGGTVVACGAFIFSPTSKASGARHAGQRLVLLSQLVRLENSDSRRSQKRLCALCFASTLGPLNFAEGAYSSSLIVPQGCDPWPGRRVTSCQQRATGSRRPETSARAGASLAHTLDLHRDSSALRCRCGDRNRRRRQCLFCSTELVTASGLAPAVQKRAAACADPASQGMSLQRAVRRGSAVVDATRALRTRERVRIRSATGLDHGLVPGFPHGPERMLPR